MSPTSSGYNSDEFPDQSPVQVYQIGSPNDQEIIPVQVQQAQIHPAQGIHSKNILDGIHFIFAFTVHRIQIPILNLHLPNEIFLTRVSLFGQNIRKTNSLFDPVNNLFSNVPFLKLT